MQPTMTMTELATATDGANALNPRQQLAEKILSMTAEELALFICLVERELGLRCD